MVQQHSSPERSRLAYQHTRSVRHSLQSSKRSLYYLFSCRCIRTVPSCSRVPCSLSALVEPPGDIRQPQHPADVPPSSQPIVCRATESDTMSEHQLKPQINGILPFLQSIEWRDPWLALLLTFHVAVTMTALMTRNHANFQIMLFLALLLLVYFSESINEVAASNWMLFSRQQYFDSNGLFISVVFSVPILMNCMIMIASWLYQSSQLMTSLKRAQLLQQARNRQLEEESASMNGTTSREKQE